MAARDFPLVATKIHDKFKDTRPTGQKRISIIGALKRATKIRYKALDWASQRIRNGPQLSTLEKDV